VSQVFEVETRGVAPPGPVPARTSRLWRLDLPLGRIHGRPHQAVRYSSGDEVTHGCARSAHSCKLLHKARPVHRWIEAPKPRRRSRRRVPADRGFLLSSPAPPRPAKGPTADRRGPFGSECGPRARERLPAWPAWRARSGTLLDQCGQRLGLSVRGDLRHDEVRSLLTA